MSTRSLPNKVINDPCHGCSICNVPESSVSFKGHEHYHGPQVYLFLRWLAGRDGIKKILPLWFFEGHRLVKISAKAQNSRQSHTIVDRDWQQTPSLLDQEKAKKMMMIYSVDVEAYFPKHYSMFFADRIKYIPFPSKFDARFIFFTT